MIFQIRRSYGQRRLILVLVVSLLLGQEHLRAQKTDDREADDSAPATKWEPTIVAFEKKDQTDPPAHNGILFVGSSSIRGWNVEESFPDRKIINRGFGGSQMSDVLHYMHRIVIPYRPRLVVLYEGDNDIASGEEPDQVAGEFAEIARRLKSQLPDTRLVYLSIKPSVARRNLYATMQRANLAIKQYCENHGQQCVFIDVSQVMMDANGNLNERLFVEDGLHLNEEGYRLWSALVRPYFGSEP